MAKTLIDTYLEPADGAACFVIIDSGIDDTYPVYEFHYVNIHPETDDTSFQFQVETTGTSYAQPMTTTYFQAYNAESGGTPDVGYSAGNDQANADVAFQNIAKTMGGGSGKDDESASGILTLYDPSSAFVKHFVATSHDYQSNASAQSAYVAGYINTTTAITKVKFMMSSGDIDSGTIKMFGVS